MEAPIQARYDKAGPQVAEALRRRHFEAHYVSTAQEALELALTLIPKDRTVSWGGTATAAQIGLMDRLHQGDYQLIDRDTGKTPEEKQALMRQALTCGTFIMSSNAISADGQLVNIDGNANRVAALCFGPESVLVIAGMNKVMGDLDSAIARARQVAAPANAQRFDIKTVFLKNGRIFAHRSVDELRETEGTGFQLYHADNRIASVEKHAGAVSADR